MEISGEAYRKCLAWRFIAGCNSACFDLCIKEQREACAKKHDEDLKTSKMKEKENGK